MWTRQWNFTKTRKLVISFMADYACIMTSVKCIIFVETEFRKDEKYRDGVKPYIYNSLQYYPRYTIDYLKCDTANIKVSINPYHIYVWVFISLLYQLLMGSSRKISIVICHIPWAYTLRFLLVMEQPWRDFIMDSTYSSIRFKVSSQYQPR